MVGMTTQQGLAIRMLIDMKFWTATITVKPLQPMSVDPQ